MPSDPGYRNGPSPSLYGLKPEVVELCRARDRVAGPTFLREADGSERREGASERSAVSPARSPPDRGAGSRPCVHRGGRRRAAQGPDGTVRDERPSRGPCGKSWLPPSGSPSLSGPWGRAGPVLRYPPTAGAPPRSVCYGLCRPDSGAVARGDDPLARGIICPLCRAMSSPTLPREPSPLPRRVRGGSPGWAMRGRGGAPGVRGGRGRPDDRGSGRALANGVSYTSTPTGRLSEVDEPRTFFPPKERTFTDVIVFRSLLR